MALEVHDFLRSQKAAILRSWSELVEAELRDVNIVCHPDDRHISVEQQQAIAAGREDLGTVEYRTEQKSADHALRSAHQEIQRHLTNTPLAVIEWDCDYRVTRFSGRAEAIFGWRAEEVVGKRIDEVPWIQEEEWPVVRAVMRDMNGAVRPVNVSQNRNRRKDGTVIHCEWFNSALYGADGRLTSVFSLIQDVTAREMARAALQESEARFRALADVAPVGVFITNARGETTFTNPASQRIMGLAAIDSLGAGWARVIHPEDLGRVTREWEAAAAAGRDVITEFRVRTRTGQEAHIRGYGAPIRGGGGAITGYAGIFIDVTAERLAASKQAASEARLRSFFESPVVGTAITSPDT